MLLIVLAGLSGCVSLHTKENGTADVSANVGVYGATALIEAQGRSTAISDGVEYGVPVSVTTTTRDGNRSTTSTVSVGYVGPAMYGSAASADWYGYGQRMIEDRAQRTGVPAQGTTVSGPVSASSVILDAQTICPTDREPTNIDEILVCLQMQTDTNTVAIENNPAVRQ